VGDSRAKVGATEAAIRAFSSQAVEAIINLRRAEPSLPVPTLVSRLEVSGVLARIFHKPSG
jgi:hypothetical protein